ncbi:FitA-like ribbon-helix-helix domain-containing protein [Microbacterium dauci]|uniref:Antitoxin FitA-like ribbon-helix-helix domain-containing protein n=1 Tax=Microbacterium dauci TaxID=3048008 RepID=A0ABT6ZCB1_9MICO|nr:hypothetical protein [Microbacterium sp. LX3-4]MDJ1113778.1 hypothetical protein [Microbacterium sp. LX3-4]
MPNILVRDLPAETHAELVRRAQSRGQSLQQFLADELGRLAARPPVEEFWTRIGHRRGGRIGLEDAAEIVRAGRDA